MSYTIETRLDDPRYGGGATNVLGGRGLGWTKLYGQAVPDEILHLGVKRAGYMTFARRQDAEEAIRILRRGLSRSSFHYNPAWTDAEYRVVTHPASGGTGRTKSSRDSARSKKPTKRQQAFIQEKIRTLRHEGYPQRQAIAIAHSMAGVAKLNPAARRDVPPRKDDARRDRGYTKRQFDAETKRNMGRERREYEREVGMLEPGAPHPRGWGESATRYRREERLAIPRSQDMDRLALRRPGGEHLQRLAGTERLRGAGWYLPIGRREQDKVLLGPYDSEREARESRARLRRRGEKNVGTPFRRAPARARRDGAKRSPAALRDPSSAKTPEELARHIAREYQQKDLSPFELRQDYGISRPKAHLIWAAAGQRRNERWLEDRVLEVLRQSGARDPAHPARRGTSRGTSPAFPPTAGRAGGTSRSRRDGAKRSPVRVKRGAG